MKKKKPLAWDLEASLYLMNQIFHPKLQHFFLEQFWSRVFLRFAIICRRFKNVSRGVKKERRQIFVESVQMVSEA